MMENEKLIDAVLAETNVERLKSQQLFDELAAYINQLILTNFTELINVLYRLDVSEAKLKTLLLDLSNEDAAIIITNLIIERQQQKIASREQFRFSGPIDEDEKW